MDDSRSLHWDYLSDQPTDSATQQLRSNVSDPMCPIQCVRSNVLGEMVDRAMLRDNTAIFYCFGERFNV